MWLQVPFRLTRMLEKAMEVSGIEGNFRSTCEKVMQVLRTNKDSVMAMMEAFVHDPLINWRLFTLPEVPHGAGGHGRTQTSGGGGGNIDEGVAASNIPSPPQRGVRERELLQVHTFSLPRSQNACQCFCIPPLNVEFFLLTFKEKRF